MNTDVRIMPTLIPIIRELSTLSPTNNTCEPNRCRLSRNQNPIPNPNSPFGFGQYTNRDEQVTKGIELDWSYALTEQLELRGTYTHTDSESTEGSNTFRTEQIADNKANLGLRYRAEKFNVGVNAYYSGPRLRWNGDFEMESYTRIDLSGSYQFTNNLYGVRNQSSFSCGQ